jgi:DNA-directed RNA polymerase specialized sigma24 family protein
VLHYLENVPLRQVATLLAVTPSRVSQLHHKALDHLKKGWQRTNGFRQPESTGFNLWEGY